MKSIQRKHTPAEWSYEERCTGIAIIRKCEDGEKIIATILPNDDEEQCDDEDEANALLIITAPYLLDACEAAYSLLKSRKKENSPIGLQLFETIKKAKGNE